MCATTPCKNVPVEFQGRMVVFGQSVTRDPNPTHYHAQGPTVRGEASGHRQLEWRFCTITTWLGGRVEPLTGGRTAARGQAAVPSTQCPGPQAGT